MSSATIGLGRDVRDYLDGQAPFFAGTANVIMQLGWPEVGHGVVESTVDSGNVMKRPVKRARTTVTYLAVALLGTEEERAHLRREINRQHVHVRSGPDSPVAYNAFDPELQLWVGACLRYGALDFCQRLHGPLDEDEADWLHGELARLATGLQVPESRWPATREAFDAYWAQGVRRVAYDETLRDYLHGLLDLAQLPGPQPPGLAAFHRFVNTGFLPSEFRDLLGLPWSAADEERFGRVVGRLGAWNRRVPRALRTFPYNVLLQDFRVRRRLGRPIV